MNEDVYCASSSEPVWDMSYGATQEKGISDYMIQSNQWSTITRYQGVGMCDPNVSPNIFIKLYYQMIGFRVKITDFTEGKVIFKGQYGHSYSATPDSTGNGLIDIIIGKSSMPTSLVFWNDDKTSPLLLTSEEMYSRITSSRIDSETINIIYSPKSGEEVLLCQNYGFSVKPNTRYTLSFSLSDAVANGGISAEVVDADEMKEEEFKL